MSALRILLLGSPQVTVDNVPVTVESRKALAILFYLAATRERHSRDRLAALFWPEQDQKRARSSLRHALWLLRNAGLDSWLLLDQDALDLQAGYECDLHQFQSRLEQGQLAEALALYRDDFLAGFTLRDCFDFDDWQFLQADHLRQALVGLLAEMVEEYTEAGDYAVALNYARRWLALDSLSESTHRTLMRLYAEAGQYTAALRQYETCVQMLEEEFGAPPDPETTQLLGRIRETKGRGQDGVTSQPVLKTASKIASTGSQDGAPPWPFTAPGPSPVAPEREPSEPTALPRSNLPPQPTPFVGRQKEVADIVHYLSEPTCRLLTLVGPGGIGKTRLAIQVAQQLLDSTAIKDHFADGIFFVSLAPLHSSAEIMAAITDAIGFQFYKGSPPQQQLLDYLHNKQMLLVLDNFEHLLDSVDLVAHILAATPRVKILATSREALNLRDAWFYPVDGMAFPRERDKHPSAAAQDALQLFAQSARRARPNFDLAAEHENVLHICRLVGGMPLAIELAAAWLRTLSCLQIIQELERGLDILADRYRNMPERHRSMRASLEQSWQMLSPSEQSALQRLAVFHGGFGGEAASAVAGAGLPVLAALVDKSVLRVTQSGRYQMHELLHQFAREKGQATGPDAESVRARHSSYYLESLAGRAEELVGQRPQTLIAEMVADLKNIHSAWLWAIEHGDFEKVENALNTLYRFYWIRGASQEGKELFAQTVARLRQHSSLRAAHQVGLLCVKIELSCCMFDYFLGSYASVRAQLRALLAVAATLNMQREIGYGYNLLGVIAGMEGEAAEAQSCLQKRVAIFRELGDEMGLADSLQELAQIQNHLNGNYAEAERLAGESLTMSRHIGRLDWIAHALDALAFAQFSRGEYGEAETNYTESLALFRQIHHALGTALALGGLGLIAWARGGDALAQALDYVQESLAICREIGHPLHTSSRLYMLAQVNKDLGLYQQAEAYASEGLSIAQRLGSPVFMTYNLCALADVACTLGEFQLAREYLAVISEHAHEIQPQLILVALLHRASLFLAESVGKPTPVRLEMRMQALELVLFVQRHPVALHIYTTRAARLQKELYTMLPPERVAAAESRCETHTLEELASLLVEAPIQHS